MKINRSEVLLLPASVVLYVIVHKSVTRSFSPAKVLRASIMPVAEIFRNMIQSSTGL
jgi:hypothetical protein